MVYTWGWCRFRTGATGAGWLRARNCDRTSLLSEATQVVRSKRDEKSGVQGRGGHPVGNVVNSHRDLKTQLIISHLRKIYSEVVGARGGYRSRCRGYARRDDTSNYTNVHLARAPCWGAPWRGAGSWRAGRAVRAVRRLRVVRETPGALRTRDRRPRRARRGRAQTLFTRRSGDRTRPDRV